jgi:hypothetical protein
VETTHTIQTHIENLIPVSHTVAISMIQSIYTEFVVAIALQGPLLCTASPLSQSQCPRVPHHAAMRYAECDAHFVLLPRL